MRLLITRGNSPAPVVGRGSTMSEQQHEQVRRWIEEYAHPLDTYDPAAPLDDLRSLAPLIGEAQVVAVGVSAREAREPAALQHRVVRLLVEEHGFRSVALEGDDPARLGLDTYVRTGEGDPRAMLGPARSFLRTEEVLTLVEWMRAYNARFPDDPVRFMTPALTTSALPPGGLAGIERRLAEDTIRWHAESGHRTVYWGGIGHTAVGSPRTVSPAPAASPPLTHRNAGSYVREHFGTGYVSLGVTFHHGRLSYSASVPVPPPDFAESVLDAVAPAAYYVTDLRTGPPPGPVRDWLHTPTRTRLVGPAYDPTDDQDHHLSGGALADWFDALVHVREVTPAQLL
ncbi:erythromycin esterase family protein [Streptomyces sp. NPDC048248]|uniref:erythromycin esterase family protein n=1 Tax=Streptomyces sp. NPDC048248 TaxID=3365523 RepID=UPI00371A8E2A